MNFWTRGLAYDRMSPVRTYDLDGRLRVDLAVISQANIGEYWGEEIIDGQNLGLDPQKMYRLYRPPEELIKAIPSVSGLPILSAHEPVDAVIFRPDLLLGATLSDACFEYPHLLCSIAIWSADAIDDIESGKKGALSAGYRYSTEWRSIVTPSGERADGSMRDIVFNHVALVDRGRIGPDSILVDRARDEWDFEARARVGIRSLT